MGSTQLLRRLASVSTAQISCGASHLSTLSTSQAPFDASDVLGRSSSQQGTSVSALPESITASWGQSLRGFANFHRTVYRPTFRMPDEIRALVKNRLLEAKQNPVPGYQPPAPSPQPMAATSRRVGCIAVKAGMTQEWDEWGVRVPLTVLFIDDCQVRILVLNIRHLVSLGMNACGCLAHAHVMDAWGATTDANAWNGVTGLHQPSRFEHGLDLSDDAVSMPSSVSTCFSRHTANISCGLMARV